MVEDKKWARSNAEVVSYRETGLIHKNVNTTSQDSSH